MKYAISSFNHDSILETDTDTSESQSILKSHLFFTVSIFFLESHLITPSGTYGGLGGLVIEGVYALQHAIFLCALEIYGLA